MERIFEIGEGKMLTLFLNSENFTNVRLARWQPMYAGARMNSIFEEWTND